MSSRQRSGTREIAPRFATPLVARHLPWQLGLLGAALAAPSAGIGFELDDYVHRFMYSGQAEGQRLLDACGSPFGIANGDEASNHWQIERGYAPWWTPPRLLVSPFRPLSALSHRLDAALWPHNAIAMHVHSLLWYALLCVTATYLFRSLLGRDSPLAGFCALLFAIDYNHGFAVGWIANRNAVIAACLGLASLGAYIEGRRRDSLAWSLLAAALLAGALFAGESSLAVFGYMVAYALCLERGSRARRLLWLAPQALVVLGWKAIYSAGAHGAHGSGLYLDPGREPLRFALALAERIPLVVLGQFAMPPSELPLFIPALRAATLIAALVVSAWLVLAAWPLLRRDPSARFFALGMTAAIPLACATHPHSRLLYFVSFGAIGLLGRLWYGAYAGEDWMPRKRPFSSASHGFAALFTGFHLLLSPLLFPLMACSVTATAPIQRGVESALASAQGEDLIIMNAPEYFYVKLIRIENGLRNVSGQRRLRALSFGAVPLAITRPSASTLELRFVGGLLRDPLLELFRNADDPLPVGSKVSLAGLEVTVRELTADGHVLSARFSFDRSVDDPRLHFAFWDGQRFAPYRPPAVGASGRLPAAELRLGL